MNVNEVSNFTVAACLLLMLCCPVIVLLLHATVEKFDSSISRLAHFLLTGRSGDDAGQQLLKNDSVLGRILWILPSYSHANLAVILLWVAFQLALYLWLPGKNSQGQRTPAGHLLLYKTNGFSAWCVTHAIYLALAFFGSNAVTWIPRNFGPSLISANILGFLTAAFAYVKALYWPTHPDDCKFSGSRIYDFFMGVEFNPRITVFNFDFDFKLFHNGRPGIVAWTLISASCAALQLHRFGHITAAMQVALLLHTVYVVDFFVHEDWYLRTIDIAHDHFGFYLAWGDYVWLPATYTLQTRYLATRGHDPGWSPRVVVALAVGLAGYAVFRMTNNQKDRVRKAHGNCSVWGRPARVLLVTYTTSDQEQHESLLLASGFWGVARHMNYLGDLCLALGMCLACGLEHALPHFYFVYMGVLLVTRIRRDDARCRSKYGAQWDDYCRIVPYKLIPYVW